MSISRKLTTIAENQQRVYDAGYAKGQAEGGGVVIDPDKIIEKTVTGTIIRVDDVSEIPHKCTVSVDKDANVTVCGKNLITIDGWEIFDKQADGSYKINKRTITTDKMPFLLPSGVYCASGYIKCPTLSNCRPVLTHADGTKTNLFATSTGDWVRFEGVTKGSAIVSVHIDYSSATEELYIKDFQIEMGTTATAYEPYNAETHPITAEQTIEVDSICPTMTLLADNDATITFVYQQSWGIVYGKQAEYDRFWEAYENNGGNYEMAFASHGWTDETYNPKQPIICTQGTASNLFRNAGITDTKQPIEIRVANADNVFMDCTKLKTIPYIGFFGVTSTGSFFIRCNELENITVGGEVASAIGFHYCPKLTNESVQSIIDHLADLTGQSAKTIRFHATVGGNLTDEQKATITAKNWTLVY